MREVFAEELQVAPYESDQVFQRLLRSHPGVVVSAHALLSAAPHASRVSLPPLVRLLTHARKASLPVLLHAADRARVVRAEYKRRGLQQLWTEVLEEDERPEQLPLGQGAVTVVLPEEAAEFVVPVPGLLTSVCGRMIGPPQHPVPTSPLTQAMLVQAMAGRTMEEIAQQSFYTPGAVSAALYSVAASRGCRSPAHLVCHDVLDGYLDPATAERAALTPSRDPRPDDLDVLIATIDRPLSEAARRLALKRHVAEYRRDAALKALGARTTVQAVAIGLAIRAIPEDAIPLRDPYLKPNRTARRLTGLVDALY
ncbi:hypothetical protein [Kitasatospora phosalacinea]|uniref:Uncharacterized protein n=1 Tax=Kitasatospora phosalacinea TaxID=2065 RepID=A0A9W6PPI3_9ACTN|nr:hypothetical protein [Kitasatospora phosalacinea]GLW58546.1 hypothetical protein Kpho01_65570 [Kitasatospora phosalacinea]